MSGTPTIGKMTPNQLKKREKMLKFLRKQSQKSNITMTTEEEEILIKEQIELREQIKNIRFIDTLRQVWYLLSGSRKNIPWLFVCMVVNSVLGLIGVSMVIPFILFLQNADAIYGDVSNLGMVQQGAVYFARYVFDVFHFTSSIQLVVFFGVVFLVMFMLRIAVGVGISYVMNIYTAYATKNLSEKIYTVILYMSYGYYLGRSSAQTMFAMSLSEKSFNIIMGLLNLINDLTLMVALGVGITLVSPPAIVVGVALGLIAFITYKLINKELRRIAQLELILSRKQNMAMYQGVHNFTFSRLFHAEPFFLKVFHLFYDRTIPLGAYKSIISSLPRIVLELSITAAFVLYAIIIIVKYPERSSEVITTAAVFAAAVFKLMPAALRVSGYMSTLAGDQAAVNEFYEEYQSALNHRVEGVDDSVPPLPFEKSIEVKTLGFRYPRFDDKGRKYDYNNSPVVLNNVSLSISKGQRVGIVGGSGGGKTTLIHILMAFLNLEEGSVTVDGEDIHKNMRRWQKNIGYVPQDTLLMEDTVAHNIAFGIPSDAIDKEKVKEVLKIAELWDVVEAMPKGLKTLIGDHGKRLSGGQRQRLGIARALYRDPSVLFFDEATSHLDAKTEQEVQASIDNLPSTKTLIIVAHRINTLRACDVIYKIDNGSISFSGTYDELCVHMHEELERKHAAG